MGIQRLRTLQILCHERCTKSKLVFILALPIALNTLIKHARTLAVGRYFLVLQP
jgi:hypothetical protein